MGLYRDLLAPNFEFVDETTATRFTGRARELELVNRVFSNTMLRESGFAYRPYFLFDEKADDRLDRLAPEEAARGCRISCGLIQIFLFRYDGGLFLVNDETCLTVCPQRVSDLWLLTKWRILRTVPELDDFYGKYDPVDRWLENPSDEQDVVKSWGAVKLGRP